MSLADLNFSPAALKLICAIIKRNFSNFNTKCELDLSTNYSSEEIVETNNRVIETHESSKRIEENNKFVYKYTMMHLRTYFYVINNLENSKESEILFYEYYFKDFS